MRKLREEAISTINLAVSAVNPDLAPLGVSGLGRGRRGGTGKPIVRRVLAVGLSVVVDVSAVPAFPDAS
jgi:hypothetical protein